MNDNAFKSIVIAVLIIQTLFLLGFHRGYTSDIRYLSKRIDSQEYQIDTLRQLHLELCKATIYSHR
jgi:hypothetical protein